MYILEFSHTFATDLLSNEALPCGLHLTFWICTCVCITQAYTIAHILNIPLASRLHNLNLHLISQGFSINPLISATIIDTPLSPFWIQCNIHIISHPRTLLITSTIHLMSLYYKNSCSPSTVINYICLPSLVAWNMCPWNSEESSVDSECPSFIAIWLGAHRILRILNYYFIMLDYIHLKCVFESKCSSFGLLLSSIFSFCLWHSFSDWIWLEWNKSLIDNVTLSWMRVAYIDLTIVYKFKSLGSVRFFFFFLRMHYTDHKWQ